MKPTVLITGASSGIGLATAKLFAERGWNVAATMRQPDKDLTLHQLPNVTLFALDVTDAASVGRAIEQAIAHFGKIDALVNNAGYGADGVFEAMDDTFIQEQFDTNVFGLMRVSRAVLPHFRSQQKGHLIQVASMGGRLAFPLFSIYHGTKWAVEGFSESLQWELAPFNIHVKLIEPGAIKTEFYGRSRKFIGHDHPAYTDFVAAVDKVNQEAGAKGDTPEKVANAIWKAANDTSSKMRFPVGAPAPLLLRLRKFLPDIWWFAIVRKSYRLR